MGQHHYLLTFCTIHRVRFFELGEHVDNALQQVRVTLDVESFANLAYCFMPDHLHLLVKGLTAGSALKQFAKMAKQRSGASHALRNHGQLWQEGYWDNVVRADDVHRVARYILENPVRARLVASPREYPYLGSDVWTLDEILGAPQNQ